MAGSALVWLLVGLAGCSSGGSGGPAAGSDPAGPPPAAPAASSSQTRDLAASSASTENVQASQARQVRNILSEFNARQVPQGVVLTLPEKILFDFDKAVLRPEAGSALAKIAEVAKFYPNAPLEITGFTDSKGADAYNLDLSRRRAQAVVAALVSGQGLPDARLAAQGKGEADPVAPNEGPGGVDNPVGRQQNRRVEVLVQGVKP